MSNKTTLEPIDGARSRLTGESAISVPSNKAAKAATPKKKAVEVDGTEEEAIAAFSQSISEAVEREPSTATENLNTLVERIERIKGNRVEWENLSHAQRLMMTGALYAAKEVLGEKNNGIPVSFSRFLGIAFK
jgi:hypothetical protein